MDLLCASERGIWCAPGGFHIDPWRPVDTAVITHGHADHARAGSALYLCHHHTAPILRKRLGDVRIESVEYGQSVTRNAVRVSLHPAGHVLGSAQVRVEWRGEVWVASGDYKLQADGLSTPFEPVRCEVYITESTFALPIYHWRPQSVVMGEVNAWWSANQHDGRASLLGVYGLGKAQRVLAQVDTNIGPVVCHGAVEHINAIYRQLGAPLPLTHRVDQLSAQDLRRSLVLAPPSALAGTWARRLGDYSDGFASGWMQVRGNRRRRGVDRGFVLSDHADWPGLTAACAASGAQRILVTHGASGPLIRYLRERGLDAAALATEYGDEHDAADDAAHSDATGSIPTSSDAGGNNPDGSDEAGAARGL